MSEPQIGDVIRSKDFLGVNRDGVLEYVHVRLDTAASVAEAVRLIAAGRWVLVERRADDERPDAQNS